MCVILVGKVNKEMHEKALAQNGDGFSLYTAELGLVKSPTDLEVIKAWNTFGIWHYRIATSGKIDDNNIHPFPICKGEYLLYHNGVLGKGLGSKSDTHALADTLMNVSIETADSVIRALTLGNRFLIVSAVDPLDFKVYGDWSAEAGLIMSHKLYHPVGRVEYSTLTKSKQSLAAWEGDTHGKKKKKH